MPYGMPPQQGPQQGFLAPNDPLVAVGTTMLRQSGANYLESGKRYMQSWTGVLSGAMLQHHFNISSSYGAYLMTALNPQVAHESSPVLRNPQPLINDSALECFW